MTARAATRIRRPQRRKQGVPEVPPPETEAWIREHQPCSYWEATRRPFPSLLFVAPMIAAYEAAVILSSGEAEAVLRSGADAWMRRGLASAGLSHPGFLPLILILALMGWQLVRAHDWRFSPSILAGMIAESLVWAIALLGIGRLIDLGFSYLDRGALTLPPMEITFSTDAMAPYIGYLGAGIYEEALFRLLLVPVFYGILRLLQTPQMLSSAWAVTGSALLFALAHHAGIPGEPFTWYAFIFRWMAGVFFAWVFVLRGFGIAVGTHTAYDILVGWIG